MTRCVCFQPDRLSCRIEKVSAKDGEMDCRNTNRPVRYHGRIGFTSHERELLGIGPQTSVIRVGTGFALGRFATDRFAVQGIPTLLAVHQALEQIARPTAVLPRMTAVLLHLFLDGGKQRGVDQGRDGDGKPLGDRHIIVGSRATRLLWTAPLGPQAWTEGALTRFPKRRG